ESTDHTSGGVIYDRAGSLKFSRAVLRAQGGTLRQEPLATLGDSLALCRQWISGSAAVSESFDVGAYEWETILLVEVDAEGRRRGQETFAADRAPRYPLRSEEHTSELH